MYLFSSHSTRVLIFFLLTWHLYSARHLYSAFQLCILSEVRLLNFLRLLLLLLLLPPLQAPPLLVYGMQHAACHMRLISPTVWGLRWCNFLLTLPASCQSALWLGKAKTPGFLLSPILQYVGIANQRQNVLMTVRASSVHGMTSKKTINGWHTSLYSQAHFLQNYFLIWLSLLTYIVLGGDSGHGGAPPSWD